MSNFIYCCTLANFGSGVPASYWNRGLKIVSGLHHRRLNDVLGSDEHLFSGFNRLVSCLFFHRQKKLEKVMDDEGLLDDEVLLQL